MRREIDVVSLLPEGRVPWDAAFALQKEAERRVKEDGRETLFLLEHADVITFGRNAAATDLRTPRAALEKLGIAVVETDRGGKLTFHGPGQLVAYPIVDLSRRPDVRRFVNDLEEVLIRTAADFGVAAARSHVPERWASVWVGDDKLAAIGIHLSRWVTTHGVALNVTSNLARFSLFVPCGIADGGVTSLQKARPDTAAPALPEVAVRFVTHFAEVLEREPVETAAEDWRNRRAAQASKRVGEESPR